MSINIFNHKAIQLIRLKTIIRNDGLVKLLLSYAVGELLIVIIIHHVLTHLGHEPLPQFGVGEDIPHEVVESLHVKFTYG